eukprot:TRINITY_DN7654_c0_g1_i1.p1 TRINITY_DN7654_c0_g1~~TRINITY_DN7654_c0_g1_i1.p1  ORF type:complete len:215 (-),score=43.88 TRINITY_DN7654_c0_g1_i1:273-917(-)
MFFGLQHLPKFPSLNPNFKWHENPRKNCLSFSDLSQEKTEQSRTVTNDWVVGDGPQSEPEQGDPTNQTFTPEQTPVVPISIYTKALWVVMTIGVLGGWYIWDKDLQTDKHVWSLEDYQILAIRGSTDAMVELGLYYWGKKSDLGVCPQSSLSPESSFFFLKQAALRDDVDGQYFLGLSYLEGNGVVPNIDLGVYHLKLAFKAGHKGAGVVLSSL